MVLRKRVQNVSAFRVASLCRPYRAEEFSRGMSLGLQPSNGCNIADFQSWPVISHRTAAKSWGCFLIPAMIELRRAHQKNLP